MGYTYKYAPYEEADFMPGGVVGQASLSKENALLREILRERYVTFFGQILGFNDLRRTRKETAVTVKVSPNAGTLLPERFIYSQTELNANSNAPKVVPGLFVPTPVNQ